MGYYLTKRNKLLIQDIILRMDTENKSFELNSTDPSQLVYILRNALNTDFKELKGKFRIKKRGSVVEFQYLSQTLIEEDILDYDLLEIMSDIIQNKPKRVSYKNRDDWNREALYKIANAHNYLLQEFPNKITFTQL